MQNVRIIAFHRHIHLTDSWIQIKQICVDEEGTSPNLRKSSKTEIIVRPARGEGICGGFLQGNVEILFDGVKHIPPLFSHFEQLTAGPTLTQCQKVSLIFEKGTQKENLKKIT